MQTDGLVPQGNNHPDTFGLARLIFLERGCAAKIKAACNHPCFKVRKSKQAGVGPCRCVTSTSVLVAITGTTNIALHHSDASVVNQSAEPRFLNLNPEGSAGLLKSDDAESSHSHEVAITINEEAVDGSNSNEVAHKLPSLTGLREPESCRGAGKICFLKYKNFELQANILIALVGHEGQAVINLIHAEQGNNAANPHSEIKKSTSFPAVATTSDSKTSW
ncbi:hypothetical protein PCANC_26330 [Puccinia coronata f. sp. avenae]|uniref:Uncharacterized protein n=1 Tax=Puccinia coronata f. sp. avenae TaxID=200324 RepID=A0A2N5RZ41_9BASI|nr:hypothetical protein PCANC_26330 [Puccinia coronata f. sp. avenae]